MTASNHQPPTDPFHNQILSALRGAPHPDDEAALDEELASLVAAPLAEASVQRILRRVRVLSQQETPAQATAGHPAANARGSSRPQAIVVVACLALIAVVGIALLVPGSKSAPQFARQHSDTPPAIASQTLARLKIGQTLRTGHREKQRVMLPDGSLLAINESSHIVVTGARRLKLIAGEVFVEAIPARTAQDRFVLETGRRTVTALGTKFLVKDTGAATNVVVTQGEVQVSGVAESLPAGQELIASPDAPVPTIQPARRASYVVGWVRDLIAAPVAPPSDHAGGSITVVDPQGQEVRLSLQKFHIDVHIEEGFARTTIDQTYFNHTWQQQEGTFRFPLPADASLSRLAMYVNGTLMEGGIVERDHGRNVFEQIRHTRRDPALLEWVDGSTFQMRVFPLEPRQQKRILLSYTQRLPADYGRSVYRFPAGHSMDSIRDWSTRVRVRGAAGRDWYSPTHLLMAKPDPRDLVLEGREEFAVADRDLVVELQPASAKPPRSLWSFYQKGQDQYLMVRLRPEWKSEARRPLRQWIFLVESTGDRSSILMESQRQVVKTLLDNVEHSDVISVVRAGTRAEVFGAEPLACSIENAAAADAFVRESRPLGALDLGQALQTAIGLKRPDREAWIVHVGTGVPVLGERDPTTLIRQIPEGLRYAGIAVGKRWSRAFLEGAATRTGGLVTQINPDDAVAWRAFDLLSTLNAPRLTGIALQFAETPAETERPAFLPLTPTVAQGQELAAVVKLTAGQAVPNQVRLKGQLNGQPYEELLEIPASLIGGSTSEGQSASKGGLQPAEMDTDRCGYLPRTWARLEIDRLVDLGAADHKDRIIALSKSQHVISPFTSLLVLETDAMYDQFKVARGTQDHWAKYPAPATIPVVNDLPARLTVRDAARVRLDEARARVQVARQNLERQSVPGQGHGDLQRLQRILQSGQAEVQLLEAEFKRLEQAEAEANSPAARAARSVIPRRRLVAPLTNSHVWYWTRNNLKAINASPTPLYVILSGNDWTATDEVMANGFDWSKRSGNQWFDQSQFVRPDLNGRFVSLPSLEFSMPQSGPESVRFSTFSDASFFMDVDSLSSFISTSTLNESLPIERGWAVVPFGTIPQGRRYRWDQQFGNEPFLQFQSNFVHSKFYGWFVPSPPWETALGTDLVAQAPGLQSSAADQKAVIAAAADAEGPGTIDPQARVLIDAARSVGWQRIRRVTPAPVAPEELIMDGSGHLVWRRQVAERLRETLIHDGTTLVHQYPDLGLGSVRTSSRFHRAEFSELNPWYVPSVEDLAADADVRKVAGRTVRITPKIRRAANGMTSELRHEMELDFGSTGALTEVRILKAEPRQLVARHVLSAEGVVQRFDGRQRLISEERYERTPAGQPDLQPDTTALVMLPLPYRSVESLAINVPANLQTNKPDYTKLGDHDAMTLLASYFAEARTGDLGEMLDQRMTPRGDRRLGYAVLLAALQINHQYPMTLQGLDPDNSMLRYLVQLGAAISGHYEPNFDLGPTPSLYLQRQARMSQLQYRWARQIPVQVDRPQQERNAEFQSTLEFLRDCQSPTMASQLLDLVGTSLKSANQLTPETTHPLALAAEHVAQRHQAPEFLAGSRIEWSLASKDERLVRQARELFLDEIRVKAGRSQPPSLRPEIRQAYVSFEQTREGQPCVAWGDVIREASQGWLEDGQGLAMLGWAQSALTMGEPALATELYEKARARQSGPASPEWNELALKFCKAAGRWDEAFARNEAIRQAQHPQPTTTTLRDAAEIAFHQKRFAEWIRLLNQASQREFAALPKLVNLQVLRQEYDQLFTAMEQRVEQVVAASPEERKELAVILQEAAERWRSVDDDDTACCHRTARALGRLGEEARAWDYWTTPLAEMPDQSAVWMAFADAMNAAQRFTEADRAWTTAFVCEPTNPEILLKHAQFLAATGQRLRANVLLDQIARGEWQPRFEAIKTQAKTMLGP